MGMERARIGHELRTPLAVIKGALQMAERHPRRSAEWVELAIAQTDVLERAIAEVESQLPDGVAIDDASEVVALEIG
jgi:signal transduction histidine kinase